MLTLEIATARIELLDRMVPAKLAQAQTELQQRIAKMQTQTIVSSFDLEYITNQSANVRVYATVKNLLESTDGLDARVRYTALQEQVSRYALRPYMPNSTSNQSVELDLHEHFTWIEFFNDYLNDFQYRNVETIAKDLGIIKPEFCVECEGKDDNLSDLGLCAWCFEDAEKVGA